MRRTALVTVAGVVLTLTSVSVFATGRTCSLSAGSTAERSMPRTPWGDPDLQGVWSGAASVLVPLDRDPALGTRNV